MWHLQQKVLLNLLAWLHFFWWLTGSCRIIDVSRYHHILCHSSSYSTLWVRIITSLFADFISTLSAVRLKQSWWSLHWQRFIEHSLVFLSSLIQCYCGGQVEAWNLVSVYALKALIANLHKFLSMLVPAYPTYCPTKLHANEPVCLLTRLHKDVANGHIQCGKQFFPSEWHDPLTYSGKKVTKPCHFSPFCFNVDSFVLYIIIEG